MADTEQNPGEEQEQETQNAPASEQETSGESEVDWSALFTEDDEEAGQSADEPGESGGEDEEPQPAAASKEEAPSKQPAQTEKESAPADKKEEESEQPKADEEAQPQPAAEQKEKPAEEKPQAPESQQEQPGKSWDDLRNEAREALTKHYALSDEQKEALENGNFSESLPKMAADLHVQIYDAVFASVMQQVPNMMRQLQQYDQQVGNFNQRFSEKWPNLKGHEQTVQRFIDTVRSVQPDIDEDQLIQQVGVQASVMLGLPLEGGGQQPPASQQAPASQPQQPAEPTPPPAGYRPAQPSGGTPPPSGQPMNQWEEIISSDE